MDWEDGIDLIDFSRADNVSDINDLEIEQLSDTEVLIAFTNDKGKTAEVGLTSSTAFTLDLEDLTF